MSRFPRCFLEEVPTRVWACLHVRVSAYVYAYVCAHGRMRTYVRMRVRALRVCVYAPRMPACACVYACTRVYVYAGTRRMRLCVCLYVCASGYADACLYVRVPKCLPGCLRRVYVERLPVCLRPCLPASVPAVVCVVIRDACQVCRLTYWIQIPAR